MIVVVMVVMVVAATKKNRNWGDFLKVREPLKTRNSSNLEIERGEYYHVVRKGTVRYIDIEIVT